MTQDIYRVWHKIEDQLFQEQPNIEEKALSLYQKDPSKARQFLTEYCIQQAEEAVAAYWELGDDLWVKYSRYF